MLLSLIHFHYLPVFTVLFTQWLVNTWWSVIMDSIFGHILVNGWMNFIFPCGTPLSINVLTRPHLSPPPTPPLPHRTPVSSYITTLYSPASGGTGTTGLPKIEEQNKSYACNFENVCFLSINNLPSIIMFAFLSMCFFVTWVHRGQSRHF